MAEQTTGPQLVTITVDDQEYQVPAGMALIDAISNYTDFHMPRFCYHDRMDPVGMCRMCMAEVETRGRWANAATCTLKVADGMKVRVRSEEAIKSREMVLELLLLNHPLDCPVCDKGGECLLQDQTMSDGPQVARTIDPRRVYEKPIYISEDVLLDRERCIQCGLCVRFVDEIAAEKAIMFFDRGYHMEVATAKEGTYEGHFAGNTCDICPVGALTSSTFRFASRPWEMKRHAALSLWDSGGGNLWLDVRENKIRRVMPRENRAVNDVWCSDRDRFQAHSWVLSPERLDVPLVRNPDNGQLEPASYDDALKAAIEGLAKALEAGQPVATVAGAHLGLEELAGAMVFGRDVTGGPVVASSGLEVVGRTLGAMPDYGKIERARAILVVGTPAAEHPNAWLRMVKAFGKKGAPLYTIGARDRYVALASSFDLACEPGQEGAVLTALAAHLQAEKQHNLSFIRSATKGFAESRDGWSADLPDGVDRERFVALAARLAGAEDLLVYAGWQADAAARAAAWNLALLLGTPGMTGGGYLEPLPAANTRGAAELGLGELASLPAELGALVVLGSDLGANSEAPWQRARDRWGAPGAREAGGAPRAPFTVVSELFLTRTARDADVVLPATCAYERQYTAINYEGRVQRVPAAVRPILGVRGDLDILDALAAGLTARQDREWEALDAARALALAGDLAPRLAGLAGGVPRGGVVLPSAPAGGRYNFV